MINPHIISKKVQKVENPQVTRIGILVIAGAKRETRVTRG